MLFWSDPKSAYFSKEGESVKALDPNWAQHVNPKKDFEGFKQ